MKLKSFGCSFTYGSDLADCTDDQASRLTWPALLSEKLGLTYECHAWPGIGNLRITEQLLNKIDSAHTNDVFVVEWTWIDRFDYYLANCNNSDLSPWRTIVPVDESDLAKIFYKELHSEYRDKLATLINIKLVIDSLKQKQIKFIMIYMDDLLFDQRWHTSPAVNNLQNNIKPYMATFDSLTFLNWSRLKKYPVSHSWHPLEQAHAAAAEYMAFVFSQNSH